MVTNGLNKITQNETQDPQLVDNFCKSWGEQLGNKNEILGGQKEKRTASRYSFLHLERETRFELATLTMARLCSTN